VDTLQLFFLGPFDIRSGDLQLPRPPTQKSQSLLGYLVYHRKQPLPREHLCGHFFGDRPERNARRSLSTALWHIHRCLPGDTIFWNDSQTVQLSPHNNLWVDVEEFETLLTRDDNPSLRSAVDLYRGDFLDGFYDDWVISERYRVESLYLGALARLMNLYESSRNYQPALATALKLLSRDALREDAHQIAMRMYCHLGQRKLALDHYARCRQVLQEEIGTLPMSETTELYQAILAGKFKADLMQPEISLGSYSPEPKGRNPLDVVAPIRLVGREREMQFLENTWQRAQSGSSLVLISGEVGVGKTRLAEEFSNRLSWQGFIVLKGNCYEFERGLPYQPIADALWSSIPSIPDSDLSGLPDWAMREVARLAPELLDRPALKDILAEPPAGATPEDNPVLLTTQGTDSGQLRLFKGVTRLLVHLSSKKAILIVLEDLHWASESSLQMLHHLIRHLSAHPVMIIGTYRPEAVSLQHSLHVLYAQLARDGLAQNLEINRLSYEGIYTILTLMSGTDEAVQPLASRLYQETEGNPFFLMEVIKTLFETDMVQLHYGVWQGDFNKIGQAVLPPSNNLSAAVLARVHRLDAKVQEALQYAAVLGREFSFEVFNANLDRGEEATLETLDALLRHRLIEEKVGPGESDFSFTHHKIQEVVYQSMQRRRRAYLHASTAAAIEKIYPSQPEDRAVELAFHFEQACRFDPALRDKAVHYLILAGQQAVRQSAHQEAIICYQRGLTILKAQVESDARMHQEIELLLALAVPVTATKGYVSSEAKTIYSQAYDLCQKLDQTPELFTCLVGLARYYGLTGNSEKSKVLSEQLFAIAQQSGDADLFVEAHRHMGASLFIYGRLQDSRAIWERGLALYNPAQHEQYAYRFGHDMIVTFLAYLGMTLWLQGYPDQSLVHHRNLLGRILSMTNPSSQASAYCHLALQASLYSTPQEALDYAEAAIQLGIAHGLGSWTILASALKGWAMCEQGSNHKKGMELLHDSIQAWQTRGFTHLTPILLVLKARAYAKLHKQEEAICTVQTALEQAQHCDRFWMAEILSLMGDLFSQNGGDWKNAEAYYYQAIEIAREQGAKMLELHATVGLAHLLRSQKKNEAAHRVLSDIYNQFNEGFRTVALIDASALLEELVKPVEFF
jgi:DNA-binding SARP family transcriptional activator